MKFYSHINVLSAGPCAGKTTTVRELSARGYFTYPEASRLYFDEMKSRGFDSTEVRGGDFQKEIEDRRVEMEMRIPEDLVTILDRSAIDNIAYRRHFGADDSEEYNRLVEHVENYPYDKIFVLDQLDFEQDDVRDEDGDEAAEIHNLIIETYNEFGYDPIFVPVMSVEERADYIEDEMLLTPSIH